MQINIADINTKYKISLIDNVACLVIPINDILYEDSKVPTEIVPDVDELEKIPFSGSDPFKTTDKTVSLFIPTGIRAVYKSEDALVKDVSDFLNAIAKSWEFKQYGYNKNILKKAVGNYHPKLNTVIFKKYGDDADELLTDTIQKNKEYIKEYWKNHDN